MSYLKWVLLAVCVSVYDVSADRSNLSIQTHHLIIKADRDTLIFKEYMQLVNSSTMAVAPPQAEGRKAGAVVQVRLPKGFRDFESQSYFLEDARMEDTGRRFCRYDGACCPADATGRKLTREIL